LLQAHGPVLKSGTKANKALANQAKRQKRQKLGVTRQGKLKGKLKVYAKGKLKGKRQAKGKNKSFPLRLLRNVACRLQPGGVFVGTTTDANVLILAFVARISGFCGADIVRGANESTTRRVAMQVGARSHGNQGDQAAR
tara:strand:+ start:197 stop:613 length:417 start_codon:yes stop_codon:yes gene_type:complete